MFQGNEKPAKTTIAILGAGSWGATLAALLAQSGKQVLLYARNQDKAAAIESGRQVTAGQLSIEIPQTVSVTSNLGEAAGCEVILFCCTAQSMREQALALKDALGAPLENGESNLLIENLRLVSAAKGIELKTTQRMSTVLQEVFPRASVCALSGPNLAGEISAGLPAASVIASASLETARGVQKMLSVSALRLYANDDLIGVELGGALKNVIAIAAGCVDGLKLGTNAKAALMTRGLAEITRMAVAMGAKATTLSGLSGMGDLVATCYSSLSRNYRLGHELAQGASLEDIQLRLGTVAEGVTTCEAVCELSQKLGIELPIAQQVNATLRGSTTPKQAIMTLMSRPLASE